MRFIKSFFKSDPKEEARSKLLELELPDHAIYLPEAIEMEDDFLLVREVAEDLIAENKYKGSLVGKKGWFLPKSDDKLQRIWSKLEQGPIELEEVATQWKINEKRVYIALEEFAEEKGVSDPVFHREGMTLYLMSYFKQAWYDALASMDAEEPTTFDQLLQSARVKPEAKDIFTSYAKDWIKMEDSKYALGDDDVVRSKETIPVLIADYVPKSFEAGKAQITYYELSEKYGISIPEVGRTLQKMIDNKKLDDVTLWATDELIKPQL